MTSPSGYRAIEVTGLGSAPDGTAGSQPCAGTLGLTSPGARRHHGGQSSRLKKKRMALSPGTRLGSYEVVSALGAGGMGEVYRARHLRLGRDVAIKVLRTNQVDTAVLYLRGGDHERALEWLERAYADRDPNLPYFGLPIFDSLRDEPRFDDLVRRLNLTMWIEEH
jgi:serine/threonine protein kinase